MQTQAKGKKMGRFSVEFEVANYGDVVEARRGTLDESKVRRVRIRGVVDTGAAQLVLPAAVVKQLGLPRSDKIKVRYADGRRATRDWADDAYLEISGRHGTFRAVVEPKREEALIGAIVLETFDLLADCTHQRLVPRDPNVVLSEIE